MRSWVLIAALAIALRAQTPVVTPAVPPGTDFGVDRKYRAEFDRLITEGKIVEAEANARDLLAKVEATLGPESLEAGQALDMLVETYEYGDRVRDTAADSFSARAIRIQEKLLGPDDPHVAVSLRLMGDLFMVRADYTHARQYYERAVAIHRKTAGRDYRQESLALIAYGDVLAKTGDLLQAKAAMEESLAIRTKYFPPETLNTATQLTTYAMLLNDLGATAEAEASFRRALAIFEKKMGPDHVINATGLVALGGLLHQTGRVNEAATMLERALAIEEKAYGPDHIDLAFVLSSLAAVRSALGELPAARSHYERALAIAMGVYGEDHPEVARILSGYAQVLLRMGDREPARNAALRAEAIGRAHLALTIRTLPERQALLYAAQRPSAIGVVMAAALAEPASRRSALDAVIRSRALVLDEMAARRRAVTGVHDPEVARLSAALFAAREKLSRLVLQGPGTFTGKQYAAALDRSRVENDAAGRALAERSATYRDEAARGSAGIDEVAATLRPGDALVSFVRYGAPATYAAFVQRGGRSAPAMVKLGAALAIDGLVDALRRQVQAEAEAPGVSSKRSEALYRTAGNALRRKVWDPIEPALSGATRIFLTPDDALNLVDFGALPDGTTGYLAERAPALHYLSAERDLLPEGARRAGSGLLAMGDPSFGAILRTPAEGNVLRGEPPTCSSLSTMRFDPLPASAAEVHAIGALWRGSGDTQVAERTGEAASIAAFKAVAPGKRVVHVAAHAFFAGDGCRATKSAGIAENPLLLSGIALAGANRRDGILTAEEIAALDLEGVEWAVLSGCATGDGKLMAGEGVFGLRRAFRVAGARTVIMSLWPVDDGSTQTWMTSLYRERFAGSKSAAEAVRAAGLAALAKRRSAGLSTHPFYWAGFIAAGDGR